VWLAHVRSFIARHRATYWIGVGCLTAAVVWTLVAQSRGVAAARDRWGTPVSVWMTAGDTPTGEPIVAERREVPQAMLPRHALTVALPAGAVAMRPLSGNAILVSTDIGRGRLPLLTQGSRAVAIATDDGTIALAVGDHVDLVSAGAVLATDGVVLEVRPGAVLVGVLADRAPAVAAAALERLVVAVLRP
jgi:hypothetical protein